ncbi:hypothetical protein Q604_UNBC07867G0001, partial [human gut metagenome]
AQLRDTGSRSHHGLYSLYRSVGITATHKTKIAYSFSASGDYCLRRDIFADICLILLIINRHLQVLPPHLRLNALAARALTH